MVRISNYLRRSIPLSTARDISDHLLPPVAKLSEQIVSHGKGSWVWTTDGKKLLDFTMAIGALSTGHCHPRVVEAIQQQAAQLIHAGQNLFTASKPLISLLDRLSSIMPAPLSRHFFCSSGSEAVENAIKIARAYTGKQNIIAFNGGYHGRTMGAMSVTTSKTIYRQMYGPLMPGVHVAPYPYCLHCDVRKAQQSSDYQLAPPVTPLGDPAWTCCGTAERALDWMFQMQTHPNETAAIIIEPILGEGGFVTPPPDFLARLRHVCDTNGMLLIMDEVQAGSGRTGHWWGHQNFTASQPDIVIFAKGICSGFPFAGLSTRPDLYESMKPGSMGGTYGASALGCAAATATIDAIIEDGMLDNARNVGLHLASGLLDIARTGGYPITDIRGKGLMLSVEFGGPDGALDAPYGIATEVVKTARHKGLMLMTAGSRECIRFLPALNVSAAEVDQALQIFNDSCSEVFKERHIDENIAPGQQLVGGTS